MNQQSRRKKPITRRTIAEGIRLFERLLRRQDQWYPGFPLQRERVLLILSFARISVMKPNVLPKIPPKSQQATT